LLNNAATAWSAAQTQATALLGEADAHELIFCLTLVAYARSRGRSVPDITRKGVCNESRQSRRRPDQPGALQS
jgi:hypothetical protein